MNKIKEEDLPPLVEYWLSPEAKHDCYFNVGSDPDTTERIGAFKIFLMGYSEPLRAMLGDSELAEKGDISVIDIRPDTFKNFLKCLYTYLEIEIIKKLSFQKCCDLLYVADKYLVTQLKDKLIEQCLNTLSPDINCIAIACSSEVFMQETSLEAALAKIVQCEIISIISSEHFLQFTHDLLLWILKQDLLEIDEIFLWEAVLKWAKNKTDSIDGNAIRNCINKLLKCIRFCTMTFKDFCGKVVSTDVLTPEEVYQICKYYGTQDLPNMTTLCNIVTRRHHTNGICLEPKVMAFAYHVSDICNMTKNRRLRPFQFQGFSWRILLKRNDEELGIYLECLGSRHDPSWKCSVAAELTLWNHKGSNHSLKFSHHKFCIEEADWGFTKFMLWNEVVDPSENFVLDNSITVLVTTKA